MLVLQNQNEELLARNRSPIRRAYQLGFTVHRYIHFLWFDPKFARIKDPMFKEIQGLLEGLDLQREGEQLFQRINSVYEAAMEKDETNRYSERHVEEARKSLSKIGIIYFGLEIENKYDSETKRAFLSGFLVDALNAAGGAGVDIDLDALELIPNLVGMHVDPSIVQLTRKVIECWAKGQVEVATAENYVIALHAHLLTFGREHDYIHESLIELIERHIDPRDQNFASRMNTLTEWIREHEVFSAEQRPNSKPGTDSD
jgi:hypothetical protein